MGWALVPSLFPTTLGQDQAQGPSLGRIHLAAAPPLVTWEGSTRPFRHARVLHRFLVL